MKKKKRHVIYGLVLLLVSLFGEWVGSSAQQTERGQGVRVKDLQNREHELYRESHALLFGVSDYTNGWADLPGVNKDIPEVKKALEKHGFKVEVVMNPARQAFDEAIESFIERYGNARDNRLVIYFAGHGHTIKTEDGKNRELGYIVPANAPRDTPATRATFKKLAVDMERIQGYARQIEAKHVLFVFDSCFSGILFSRRGGVPAAILAKVNEPVRQFITAGTEKQTVPDDSIFRKQFVAALNGDADTIRDGYVTGSELGEFLATTVPNYTNNAQTPRYGKINNPDLDRGDIVFQVRNRPSVIGTNSRPDDSTSQSPPLQSGSNTQPPPVGDANPPGQTFWKTTIDETIRLNAEEGMSDTGISVKSGEQVDVSASGLIDLGATGRVGPEGAPRRDNKNPLGVCPTGALIARIGGGALSCIRNNGRIAASQSGQLYLGFNETNYRDNRGVLNVRVKVLSPLAGK